MTGLLRTPSSNAADAYSGFIAYDGNSSDTGTRNNPIPVWKGWAGPDKYYLFAAKRLETAAPVQSVQDLNRYNLELYGQNLSGPYVGMPIGKPEIVVHGFQRGVLPNPNAPQEQRPSIPMMALPKVSSDTGWHLSQTEKNAIVFAGELAACWGLLWTVNKLKNLNR